MSAENTPSTSSGLFPAYSSEVTAKPQDQGSRTWLSNTSYKPESTPVKQEKESNEIHIVEDTINEDKWDNSSELKAAKPIKEFHEKKSKKRLLQNDEKQLQLQRWYEQMLAISSGINRIKNRSCLKEFPQREKLLSVDYLSISNFKELIAQNSKKIFIEDVGLKPEHAFKLDRKPDKNNLAFDTFYHQHVARYLPNQNSVLGLDPDCNYRANKKPLKKLANSRYCSKKNISLLMSEEDIIDLSSPKLAHSKEKFQQSTVNLKTYIPLTMSTSEIQRGMININPEIEVNPLGLYDKSTVAYLQGIDSNKLISDDKLIQEHMAEDIRKKPTKKDCITSQTSEYNKYLRDNPHDIEKWLEFIKFQDEVFATSEELGGVLKSRNKFTEKMLLEKKLAIIDKALETNPASIPLNVFKLKLSKDLWETKKLHKEWQQLIFRYPNNCELWKTYLTFLQTDFSSFSYFKIIKAYEKCLNTLISIHEGTFETHKALPDTEENILDIFTQMCYFLKQSGYHERAIGSFQALIEFNSYSPQNLTAERSLSDWINFFEPFWDSRVPRFGEENSVGWSKVMEKKEFTNSEMKMKTEDLGSKEEDFIEEGRPRSEIWLSLEALREEKHWLPWQNNSDIDDDCDDPDRMVLFDDINFVLFRLSSEKLKFNLIMRFLQFLGVNYHLHSSTDCFNFGCHQQLFYDNPITTLHQGQQFHLKHCSKGSMPKNIKARDFFIRNNQFFSFIDNIFHQSLKLFCEPYKTELKILWMQFKTFTCINSSSATVKEVKKFAKNLLKEIDNRNNLPLWIEFGCLEWKLGNTKEAQKVFEMSLISQSKNFFETDSAIQRTVICRLFRSYAQFSSNHIEEDSNYKKLTLAILASLGSGDKYQSTVLIRDISVPPISILKARKSYHVMYSQLMEDYVTDIKNLDFCNKPSLLIEWTVCYALFEFLTVGIKSVPVIFDGLISKLKDIKSTISLDLQRQIQLDMEFLYISYIHIIVLYMNIFISPLSILRNILHQALKEFPDNPCFLQLLVDLEFQFHIAGRLRRYFSTQLQTSPTIINSLYGLLSELCRQEQIESANKEIIEMKFPDYISSNSVETGIVHRLKSLFEHITLQQETQNCVLFWRLYLKFQIDQGEIKQAKSVFYQGIQHCPWGKILYLDAVGYFPDDIQEILDLMTEKEIRIRIPIEEVDLLINKPENKEENIIKTE